MVVEIVNKLISFAVSIVLHLVLFINITNTNEKQNNYSNQMSEISINEENTNKVTIVSIGKTKTFQTLTKNCPEGEYIGIGVIYNIITNEVMEVPINSPAHIAGMQIGDTILKVIDEKIPNKYSIDVLSDNNILGSEVLIHIKRKDQILVLKVKRNKICQKKIF